MARKSFVEPLFVKDMGHWEEEPEEGEDEDIGLYGSERFFPFPAKDGIDDNNYWVSKENKPQNYQTTVSVRFRGTGLGNKWRTIEQKDYKANSIAYSVISPVTGRAGGTKDSGKRGEFRVRKKQRKLRSWRNNPDAPW